MKVFVLTSEWICGGDSGFEIESVWATREAALKAAQEEAETLSSDWRQIGTPEISQDGDYCVVLSIDDDHYCEFYILEKEVYI